MTPDGDVDHAGFVFERDDDNDCRPRTFVQPSAGERGGKKQFDTPLFQHAGQITGISNAVVFNRNLGAAPSSNVGDQHALGDANKQSI
jgi:hypothetical protein